MTPSDIVETPTAPLFHIQRARKRAGDALPAHTHGQGQLTYARMGMVQVHTEAGVWLAPPQLAAWTPSGVRHRLDIMTDAELWIVHWSPEALRASHIGPGLDRAFALRVTPLLRSLLQEAVRLELSSQKAELVMGLMLHELTEIEDAPTFLPLPSSPAGARVTELALADHGNRLSLAALAQSGATSVRTLSRLFPAETGLTFKAWRQRARIVHAMDRLGRGASIAAVSRACGFASTAAFSCAFRQVAGQTPSAFCAVKERPAY